MPYVWAINFVYNTTSLYWTTAFGAPAQSQLSPTSVLGATVNDVIYTETSSLSDCLSLEISFYFDNLAQELYIHLDHNIDGMTARLTIGEAIGFTDTTVLDIGGVEYLPAIASIPSLSQVQDLVKYDKLALINGELVLRNVGGIVDSLTSRAVIGGTAVLSFLDDDLVSDMGEADPADLVQLAAFYVEDYKQGVNDFRVSLQDRRRSQDVSFPATRFTVASYPNLDDDVVDQPIPVVYGYQRELKAYPVNGKAASTTVRFRAGLLLTALTTVWVKINDTWTVVSPSSPDLPNGEFSCVAKASASDSPYECRVEATGIAVTNAPDVIKDLNLRYAGIPFTESFYDTAEWTLEAASLTTIGIVFKDVTTIFNAAQKIQGGANIPFRYEVNALGQRTIRIDDDDRMETLPGVDNVEILDADKAIAQVDTQFLAAKIRVGYKLSDESGKYLTVLDSTYSADVTAAYLTQAEVRFDTLLTNSTDATARAAFDALRFSVPSVTVQQTLRGLRYLSLRIFDVLRVALTPDAIDLDTGELEDADGREFLGVQICKVVGIDPDFKLVQNKVRLQVLGPIIPINPDLLVYADGDDIIFASGERIRTGGQA